MRVLGMLAVVALIAPSGFAHALSISKTAISGKTTLTFTYTNWKSDCSLEGGVVKVLTKAQHGKLTTRRVNVPIPRSRFRGVTQCYGKPTKGFQVYYTSAPGFHGADSFVIEVDFRNFPIQTDTFTITVE